MLQSIMYKYRQIIDIAENTFRVRYMDKKRKKGFTLTELIVVLVIIAIIAAVAVPFFINYWKKAEFRKNDWNPSVSLSCTIVPKNGYAFFCIPHA